MEIDILSAFTNEPAELDFVWPGFLAGTVGALIAPGATGKSFWALEAAMAVASKEEGGDLLALGPPKPGRVVYFAAEDPPAALIRRVHSIGKHLSKSARESIAKNLELEAIVGKRFDVMNEKHLSSLMGRCDGARLVVLDTLSRIHQLDENSNADMARVISTLEYVATSTEASILFLHHTNKGSVRYGQLDQQQAARGASALIDNTRWCAYLANMTKDEAQNYSQQPCVSCPIAEQEHGLFLRFGISKQNYDILPLNKWYRRREGGVLVPIQLAKSENKRDKEQENIKRKSDGF